MDRDKRTLKEKRWKSRDVEGEDEKCEPKAHKSYARLFPYLSITLILWTVCPCFL